ncbi:MAG TPA: amidase family protein, partial [Marmoricola sp.]|nr:amidase family protein [Marmoricola sp.]
MTASLERIERLDPVLNAFVTVCGEEALAVAAGIDATSGDAPFRGVPIGVKDLAPTAGIRTTYSSRAYADHVPDFDSAVVRRIREAGFVIVGKTNTPEFGTVAFTESELNGATRNPWNTALTPGGSSGGAAAALAAGLVPAAHATDGGGSVRIPASCCGLFGLKPSRGRVSTAPFGSFEGFSTAGPLTRTVEDAAHILDVLAGYEPGDPWWAPPPERPFAETVAGAPPRLRIAVTSTPPIDVVVDSECIAAVTAAAALVADLGHDVRDATPPWREPSLFDTFIAVWQVGPALHPVEGMSLLTTLNRGLVEAAHAGSAASYGRAVAGLQMLA